ncbi:PF04536 family protein [Leptospira wolbachii serovar Codice str. CDC]|uniref:PF04536 family protein n=1 Tax=Leptospira wolbachii serovar Codice str. CDC TaxID=1218599 RepID=R9AAG6_9LEPT|nr:TPM domain-containing protein [Leptospira wolbachii]EOQ97190.1 PF04536 family protein [Leptospira wolbachii serovar Codice str. CDC]
MNAHLNQRQIYFHKILLTLAVSTSLLITSFCSPSQEGIDLRVTQVPNPKELRNSWVEDSAGVLTDTASIDQMINTEEASSGVEIAVVTLPTIESYVPKDFAVALFNHWKIGKKDKDNGILILHVIDQRRVEIEIGYGLEGDLPDVVVKRIIDTYTIPSFKADNFQKGHADTVAALIKKLNHPELEVEQLLSDTNNVVVADVVQEDTREQTANERTDYYDYQGKAYTQLTEEEKQTLDRTIDTYNTTSNYFLNDEESRLWAEKTTEVERIEKEETTQYKQYFIFGYIIVFIFLHLLQRIFVWIIPSPTTKYHIVHKTDFPLFYGVIISPVVFTITLLSEYLDDTIFPISIFLIIAFIVVYAIFWGDLRLRKLSERLLKIRNIPRKCKKCGTTMTKLSEDEDNIHLSKGQISEELVNSIDYDVWVCPGCDANAILKFPSINPEYIYKGTSFRKIKACPECNFETFVCKSSSIISEATYSSSGKVEVKRTCAHCKHSAIEYETIPKKQKSSSGGSSGGGGGGGSFGGGSSGGGGSGGSY